MMLLSTAVTGLPFVEPYKTWVLSTDADGNGFPSPGDTLTYTVVIENTGNQNAADAVFSDTPDSNSTLVAGSVTTTLGSVTLGNNPGNTSVLVNLGNLVGGHGTATITFRVTINNPLPAGVTEISNQGFVSGSNFPSDPTDDPTNESYDDPTRTPLTLIPNIKVYKRYELTSEITPLDGIPGPGDTITYFITIINSGNQNAAGVNLSDIPDANTTLVVPVLSQARGQ